MTRPKKHRKWWLGLAAGVLALAAAPRPAGADHVQEIVDASGAANPLDGARGVAVGPDGSVFVTGLYSDNVFRIAPSGRVTSLMDATGDGAGNPLDRPRSIGVDALGNVYVSGSGAESNAFRISPRLVACLKVRHPPHLVGASEHL